MADDALIARIEAERAKDDVLLARIEGTQKRGALESTARVAGQFGAGVNSGLSNLLGAPFDLVNRGLRGLGVPVPEGSVARSLLGGINSVVGTPPAPDGALERGAFGAGQGAVDAASIAVPAAGVARATQAVGAAPSLTNRIATALAAQPVMQGTAGIVGGAVGQATESPLLGAAAALATPLAAAGGARLISPVRTLPNAERQALITHLEDQDIPVTAGQATGSRFLQNIEAQLEQLPLTAGPQRKVRERQGRAFTAASLRNAGVDSDVASPEVLQAARDRIGGNIGAVANRNTLQVTPALDGELTQIEDSLRFIPAEAAGPVRARIEQLRGMMVQPVDPADMPTIPGASYRMMDSQLGRTMRSTDNGDLRAALGDLRERLRTAMDGSISPADAAEWAGLRRHYANLMVSARAAGGAGAGAAEGQISPLALRGAVNQSTGGGYAFGRGAQNMLARAGQSVLRAPPDSGTSGRTMAQNLLTGGAVGGMATAGAAAGGPLGAAVGAGGSLLLPRVVQALMNTEAGQRYLRNQVIQNPQVTGQIAAALAAQQGAHSVVNGNP
jgi:hypothetical protein